MTGRHRVAGGIQVRGSCPAGHVTEATTDPGRVTWEGDCATDGCELPVKARERVRPAPPPPPATPVKKATKPRVKQVSYDEPTRKRDQRRPAAKRPAKQPATPTPPVQEPGGSPTGADDPTGSPASPAPAGGSGRAAGIRERITGRRQAAAATPPPRRSFRLPWE